ncbi:hypothetical protein ACSSV1_006142 [Labrenzia sp. MBR-25]
MSNKMYDERARALMIAAANSSMILACQSREDVEFAAGGKFSNEAWATIAANAGDKGVSDGRYLKHFRQELLDEKLQQFLKGRSVTCSSTQMEALALKKKPWKGWTPGCKTKPSAKSKKVSTSERVPGQRTCQSHRQKNSHDLGLAAGDHRSPGKEASRAKGGGRDANRLI